MTTETKSTEEICAGLKSRREFVEFINYLSRFTYMPQAEIDCARRLLDERFPEAANRWRIYTRISGGVTGTRESYCKDREGNTEYFDTAAAAQDRIEEIRAKRSPYSQFDQIWRAELC